jgi:hypothetical protein
VDDGYSDVDQTLSEYRPIKSQQTIEDGLTNSLGSFVSHLTARYPAACASGQWRVAFVSRH